MLLNAIVKVEVIKFRMDVRRGFLYLSTTIEEGTKKLLMLTPHKIPWGTTIYQEWILMFNLDYCKDWRFWCGVLWKCSPLSIELLAKRLLLNNLSRKILGNDLNNPKQKNPIFCVAMDSKLGWVSTIGIGGIKGKTVVVKFKFEKYPTKCHFCVSLAHLIKEFQAFKTW